jgi:hypothetical protein
MNVRVVRGIRVVESQGYTLGRSVRGGGFGLKKIVELRGKNTSVAVEPGRFTIRRVCICLLCSLLSCYFLRGQETPTRPSRAAHCMPVTRLVKIRLSLA